MTKINDSLFDEYRKKYDYLLDKIRDSHKLIEDKTRIISWNFYEGLENSDFILKLQRICNSLEDLSIIVSQAKSGFNLNPVN